MSEIQYSVEVKDVEKHFKVYMDKGSTLKERAIFHNRNRHENRQILDGISFEIPKGQAVGLIGRNGCGKSTTLKLLTKILKPNSGTVKVEGRVSSLIELGAGFHPDMSGRENIYINATIFGLKKEEIDERLEEIIRFSELEEYIDNPVRTYSSGMYMRLAFAVAINVNADVLLIDEILAVGDVSFQKKCFERLKEIKEDSMEDERIARLAEESKEKLSDERGRSILELTQNVHPEARRDGSHEVRFTKVDLYDKDGNPCQTFSTGDKVVLKFSYATALKGIAVNFNMDFVRDNWQYCYGSCFAKPGDALPVLD